MTETVSQAVARQDHVAAFLTPYRDDFATVLPSHIKAEQWMRLTTGVLRRNTQLAKIATTNPGSLLAAMLDAARLGLEVGDTYHLVPFGNEVVGIADYTGLMELAYRAGEVASVKAYVVHANDVFAFEPATMTRPVHKPDWFGKRGDMVGAYAYAELRNGSTSQVIVRSKDEIEKVRAVSRGATSKDSPWVQWPDRQWRKTVLRELMKFVPTSAEYRAEVIRANAQVERVSQVHDLPAATGELPDLDGDVVDQWPEVTKPGGAP